MEKRIDKVFGLFGNTGKPAALAAMRDTISFLEKRQLAFLVDADAAGMIDYQPAPASGGSIVTAEEVGKLSDYVITFGGDGTMLMAIQYTLPYDTPVLGVNRGKLGFLADVGATDLPQAIDDILENKHAVQPRMTLTGEIERVSHNVFALNDIVVGKSGSARVISIDTWINGAFLASFLADGLIVSTPTGSTAYSLATGGPVVVPMSEVIIISPISAHTLTARPVIVPGASRITVRARTDEGMLMVMHDGRPVLHEVTSTFMEITKGDHSVMLVKKLGPDYFQTLRTKLSWAQDGRLSEPGAMTVESGNSI
jgi:NAD+ kinase